MFRTFIATTLFSALCTGALMAQTVDTERQLPAGPPAISTQDRCELLIGDGAQVLGADPDSFDDYPAAKALAVIIGSIVEGVKDPTQFLTQNDFDRARQDVLLCVPSDKDLKART